MNRELWFRALQVGVVAPFLFHIARRRTTPAYFQTGLRLVAVAIVIRNVPPIVTALGQPSPVSVAARWGITPEEMQRWKGVTVGDESA